MDMSIIGLILVVLGIQLFFDVLFIFVCNITGVVLLNAITFLNLKYEILSYRIFKNTYKTKPSYKKPIILGLVGWIITIGIIVAF